MTLDDGDEWNLMDNLGQDLYEAWNKTRAGEGIARYPGLELWVRNLEESVVFVRKAELVTFEKLGTDGRYCLKVASPPVSVVEQRPAYSAQLSLIISAVDTSMFFGLLKECDAIKLQKR